MQIPSNDAHAGIQPNNQKATNEWSAMGVAQIFDITGQDFKGGNKSERYLVERDGDTFAVAYPDGPELQFRPDAIDRSVTFSTRKGPIVDGKLTDMSGMQGMWRVLDESGRSLGGFCRWQGKALRFDLFDASGKMVAKVRSEGQKFSVLGLLAGGKAVKLDCTIQGPNGQVGRVSQKLAPHGMVTKLEWPSAAPIDARVAIAMACKATRALE